MLLPRIFYAPHVSLKRKQDIVAVKTAASASILRSFICSVSRKGTRARRATGMKRGGFDAEGNQDDGSTMMDAAAVETGYKHIRDLSLSLSLSRSLNSEPFRSGRCG